jgi:nucleotide-binding universal stress UspA family protein
MKTIIACTDFTPSSLNACNYAALLAKKLKCKLTLFNLFEAPVVHSNAGLYGITFKAQEFSSRNKSAKLLDQLQEKYPSVPMNYFVTAGAFQQEIEEFNRLHQVEATVMGLAAKNKINRFIYGSHGINLAGKIDCPVIIVPDTYKKHSLKKIILAVDNEEKLRRASLQELEKLAANTRASVLPVHIRTEDELFSTPVQKIKINKKFSKVAVVEGNDLQEGMKAVLRETSADLVCVISKTHSSFYNFFVESNTKKIAFASKIPVMAIHE